MNFIILKLNKVITSFKLISIVSFLSNSIEKPFLAAELLIPSKMSLNSSDSLKFSNVFSPFLYKTNQCAFNFIKKKEDE